MPALGHRGGVFVCVCVFMTPQFLTSCGELGIHRIFMTPPGALINRLPSAQARALGLWGLGVALRAQSEVYKKSVF